MPEALNTVKADKIGLMLESVRSTIAIIMPETLKKGEKTNVSNINTLLTGKIEFSVGISIALQNRKIGPIQYYI